MLLTTGKDFLIQIFLHRGMVLSKFTKDVPISPSNRLKLYEAKVLSIYCIFDLGSSHTGYAATRSGHKGRWPRRDGHLQSVGVIFFNPRVIEPEEEGLISRIARMAFCVGFLVAGGHNK